MSTRLASDLNVQGWVRDGLLSTGRRILVGNTVLDLHSGLAWASDGLVGLRPQENRLLGLLSEVPCRVVHYPVMFEALYGPRTSPEAARIRLKALVSSLRKRVGDLRTHLCTAPGFGLVLYVRVDGNLGASSDVFRSETERTIVRMS